MTPASAEGKLEIVVEQGADWEPEQPKAQVIASPASPELVEEIHRRLSFRYPYQALNGLAAKRSVSQLVKQQEDRQRDDACQSRPAFLLQTGLTPAEQGTALHEFMQYAHYERAAADLTGERERLVCEGFLTREQADAIDMVRLSDFFQSALYRRMRASSRLEREVRFMVELPASELDASLPPWGAQEMVMVQGIADCVFEEGGGLIILDYKTDRVKDRRVLIDRYAPQLALYARALGETFALPVSQKLIYSFWLGESMEIS